MDSDLADTYQQQTAEEHVLNNPDTYTGSMVSAPYTVGLHNADTGRIEQREADVIPGLVKLVDEGLVNCRDHFVRMAAAIGDGDTKARPVTRIEVNISTDGVIELLNDGNGIDVAKHPQHDIWIPEMIFGHLRTSTNYDKAKKRIVGGKNGFGFKLVLIWSAWGEVETVDHTRGLKYTQRFERNLTDIQKPKVTKCRRTPYTLVRFRPDYERLGIQGLDADMLGLIRRRVYDVAAITDRSVRVKLNGEALPVRHFAQYVDLYIGPKAEAPRVHEQPGPRWEYVVALAPSGEFTQVSFVNGIHTAKGGKHVEYVLNQVVRKLTALIKKRKKVDVKPSTIKEQLMLFLRCDIDNPGFDSQTKEYMTTPVAAFGSTCSVSDSFVEKVAKLGVMDAACALTEVKTCKAAKKADGTKTRSIRGIPKLVDAHKAGTAKSGDCTLILCEGDSAKAGIVSGLSKADRDTIGVYPMRGKLFNVRGETLKRVLENKEITEIKKILGLESGKRYDTPEAVARLRYGKVLFMTDQDLDGSHIKGLGINLFDAQWPSLLQTPDFMGFMNTPILKAKKGSRMLSFYNEGEWRTWQGENDPKGWTVKYYKGLGTSTAKEFKQYFAEKRMVRFTGAEDARDALDMVFNKKRASDRKTWLSSYERDSYLDTSRREVSYDDFLSKEMIHFSKYDNDRSIPSLVDGLKTSLRKILYTGLKRNLTKEIKVAQFSGSVSEISCYHHGEASLNGAIKGLSQDFVGSNNINLFEPMGQFGTRLQGGQDAASERYIHTRLGAITRCLFPAADDSILEYLDDDGTLVEPRYYLPVIPMLLVNGSKGIGTGFSTDIQSHDPLALCDYVEARLLGNDPPSLLPYYEGFTGTVTEVEPGRYLIRGKHEVLSDKQVRITELPVGTWSEDYKKHLESLIDPGTKKGGGKLKDYKDMCTDVHVDILLTFAPGVVGALSATPAEHGCSGLEKLLKLYVTRTTSNMHVFDERDKLRKYESAADLVDAYMPVRREGYVTRRNALLEGLTKDVKLASDKARFISGVLDGSIDLRRKQNAEVATYLTSLKFDPLGDEPSYKHLTRLPMDSVTAENAKALLAQRDAKQQELVRLQSTTPVQLWREDIARLREAYAAYKAARVRKQAGSAQQLKIRKKKK